MKSTASKDGIAKEILVTNQIWKSFPTGDEYTTILKNINVKINSGEFIVLFGPSGCGKSTFLNILIGLEQPDKGDVNFMGMNIWKLNSDDRAVIRKKNIGIVYQQQNWIKSLSVIENVAFIGSLLGLSKSEALEKAKKNLNLVGMTHRANYRPYELSSGEQQRISLARALMNNPSLIVADEPTGSLDIKSGLEVIKTLKELSKSKKTILMVTHNPEYLEFADRVLFMLDGKIIKDLYLKNKDINEIKKKIIEDIDSFVGQVTGKNSEIKDKVPPILVLKQEKKQKKRSIKEIFSNIYFVFLFIIVMIFYLLLYLFRKIIEKISKREIYLFQKIEKFIIYLCNLPNRKQRIDKSISSWDLGMISLSSLLAKKSRTFITVLGVGIGIGFITFLLSIGYGLENLVINEITDIEERHQVIVKPVVGGEIDIDQERYYLISGINGVQELYPLINTAATMYYKDSQIDLVAYAVDEKYLEKSREVFLGGHNFDSSKKEIVVSESVMKILNRSENQIIGESLSLQFIPVDGETENISKGESIINKENSNYTVTGVVSGNSSPIIYFPIEKARELGIEVYSEILLVLNSNSDMKSVRN